MRYRYRGRKKRIRTGTVLLLVLLCATFLVSCVAGSNPLWLKSCLGLDLSDYRSEPVVGTLDLTDPTVEELCEIVDILVAGSTKLKSFHNTSQLLRSYRDAILNDLLRDHYSLYTGNTQLLSAAESAYPCAVISTAIPSADLERAVSQYFGGASVRHKNGDVYTYLNRSDTYTTALQPWQRSVSLEAQELTETANTYRLYFTLSDGTVSSDIYCALFVKRSDGSVYLRSLS